MLYSILKNMKIYKTLNKSKDFSAGTLYWNLMRDDFDVVLRQGNGKRHEKTLLRAEDFCGNVAYQSMELLWDCREPTRWWYSTWWFDPESLAFRCGTTETVCSPSGCNLPSMRPQLSTSTTFHQGLQSCLIVIIYTSIIYMHMLYISSDIYILLHIIELSLLWGSKPAVLSTPDY